MEGEYDIYLGDKPVGTVQVHREGLYYRFRCRCRLDDDSVCKVSAGSVSLGVLIPDGDSFALDTRLPVKRFPEGVPLFRIETDRPLLQGRFVPISPEEPFAYIARLKDAYLAQRDGQAGIMIKEGGT